MLLIVHWDGNLTEDLTRKEHVDRFPVLVSHIGISYLLCVGKLPSGTREEQAKAFFFCIAKLGAKVRVARMGFDTTTSNTGRHSLA